VSRIVKLVVAGTGTVAAVAAAFFLHPRRGARRRAAVRRESANVAALVGSVIEAPRRSDERGSDAQLATDARLSLKVAFGEPADELTVKARRGVVTLRGEVADIDDIARYDAAVRSIPGVLDVDNLLRLRLPAAVRPHVLTA
jgi:osmotically-inducible protein OsmY